MWQKSRLFQVLAHAQGSRSSRFRTAHGQCDVDGRLFAANRSNSTRFPTHPSRPIPVHERVFLVHPEMHARPKRGRTMVATTLHRGSDHQRTDDQTRQHDDRLLPVATQRQGEFLPDDANLLSAGAWRCHRLLRRRNRTTRRRNREWRLNSKCEWNEMRVRRKYKWIFIST